MDAREKAKQQGKMYFICDQKRCENCMEKKGLCHHTTDINHALYKDHEAHLFDVASDGTFWERIRK